MKIYLEELKNRLIEKNINPSHQRLKVLEYLIEKQMHPTADEIYTDLHHEIATLSKTTVYNTLKILVEANLLRELTIENNEVRYDIITEEHGHFKCEDCGKIFNFRIDTNLFDSVNYEDLNKFKIKERNMYFKGQCPSCTVNEKIKEEKK